MTGFDKKILKELNHTHLKIRNAGHDTVGKAWRGRIIAPTCARLYYVVAGEAEIETATEKITLCAGKWYLLPPALSFTYRCERALEHIYFHVQLCKENGANLLTCCKMPLSLSLPAASTDFFLGACDGSLLWGLQLYQAIYGVLFAFFEAYDIPPTAIRFSRPLEAALQYIGENLTFTLTAEEIARSTFTSRSTLEKSFRRELSTSVRRYVTERTLEKAAQLLQGTRLSVGEISTALGFADQLYFSKIFKKRYHISPTAYRKSPQA